MAKTEAKSKATKTKAAAKPAAEAKETLDPKSLAKKARQLKTELLAIRFNLQAPSLKDYRKKKKELQTILRSLS